MTDASPLWLVINSASGSFSEAAVAELHSALAAIGRPAARTIDCITEGLPDSAEVGRSDAGLIAVFGGDGTLTSCLTRLEGWGGCSLPLPGGTTNLLCGEMFGSMTTGQIVAALGEGTLSCRPRNCIRIDGSANGSRDGTADRMTALAEVLAGPGARWGDVREDLREGEVVDMVTEAVDITHQSLTGGQVRIVDPEIGREDGYAGLRLVPQAADFTLQGYHVDNFSEWFRQGLAIALRNFREGPHDALGGAEEISCRSTDGSPIELMIDGERKTIGNVVRFSLDPFALDLLGLRT